MILRSTLLTLAHFSVTLMGQVRSPISTEGFFHIFDEAWGSMAYRTFIVPSFYSLYVLAGWRHQGKTGPSFCLCTASIHLQTNDSNFHIQYLAFKHYNLFIISIFGQSPIIGNSSIRPPRDYAHTETFLPDAWTACTHMILPLLTLLNETALTLRLRVSPSIALHVRNYSNVANLQQSMMECSNCYQPIVNSLNILIV